jgi:hypothetical protein
MGALAPLPNIDNVIEGIDGPIVGEAVTATATSVPALISTKLVCEKCGAVGEAGCECGASFLRYANATSKADQVAAALLDPGCAAKSDRAIAAALGVSDKTVAAGRRATAENSAVSERRVGLDGKSRRTPSLSGSADNPHAATARDEKRRNSQEDWRSQLAIKKSEIHDLKAEVADLHQQLRMRDAEIVQLKLQLLDQISTQTTVN